MNIRSKKILLVGGGTMGSVSPLLAIAQKYPAEYLFIGTKTGPEKAVVINQGIAFQSIVSGKLRRYWSGKNIVDIFKIKLAFFVSLKILLKFKPEIVLSAGSFVAVPMIWAAWILRIPRVIHQQDIKVGLANKFMAPVASKITVTFPEQKELFPKAKVIVTGNPVRKINKVEGSVPRVVITGGGLGARSFNKFLAEFISQLTQYAQVHHVLGNDNFDQVLDLPNYYPHKFLAGGMLELLAQADIIISRSGMSLITEAAELKKALVVIPITDTHQELNAKFLAEHNAAMYVKQGSGQILSRYLDKLIAKPELRRQLGENLYKLFPRQATEKYIKVIDEVLKK